ncbi:hypothetical protein WP1_017 [Pseudomonas phage WP1]
MASPGRVGAINLQERVHWGKRQQLFSSGAAVSSSASAWIPTAFSSRWRKPGGRRLSGHPRRERQ